MSILLDPYRLDFAKYFDWNEGRLDSLFTTTAGTVTNGIGLLGHQNLGTRFNYFQALSRFYSAAVLSDLPKLPPSVTQIIHRAAEHWSVCGECFLVRSGGTLRLVRPDYVFPILNQYDREQVEQYLFVFPQLNTQENAWLNEVRAAQRANVIVFDVASKTAKISERGYTAGTLEPGPDGSPIDMSEVIWVKSGEPPYVAIEPIVREISVRLNMLQLALNTSAVPLIQVDKDNLNDGAFAGSLLGLQQFQEALNNPLGLNITPPFGGEEGARYVERAGTGLTESMEYLRMLLGQLGVLSGVPDYVFGVQLGRPNHESERVLFAGQTRVNSFRRDLESALEAFGTTVHFASEPFITRRERLQNIVQQLEAGIITQQEAREALGYEPLPGPPPEPLAAPRPLAPPNPPLRSLNRPTGGRNTVNSNLIRRLNTLTQNV